MIFTLIIFRINFFVVFFCGSLACPPSCFSLFFVLFCNWFLFIDLACSGNTLTHRRTRAQAQPEAWCDQIRRDPAADFGFGFGFGFGVADTRKFRFFFASLYFIFNYHHAYILFAFYISRASFCIAL